MIRTKNKPISRAIIQEAKELTDKLDLITDVSKKVAVINRIRKLIHEKSPFKNEPVDCVLWVQNNNVVANDYNPNKVAPPEMQLLEISITNDGYTQPIVTWRNDKKNADEVIDGFHRNRVGKESPVVKERIKGYLPIVSIRPEQANKNDRVASTIRHNRARGKHQIDAMSEIILELKNRNWTNKRISKELGMDEDEILRLCQITGLESLFSDADFSKSWEASDSVDIYEPLTEEFEDDIEVRTVNTNDPNRIFHTYDKWECHKAGFYSQTKDGMTKNECEVAYAEFLSDLDRFENALNGVISEWKYSCEHYLTNKAMNRIAWLGQASMCYATGVPSRFCSGFNLLSEEQKEEANQMALKYLNKWLLANDRLIVTMAEAMSFERQVEIY
jgi:ParB-like chromosome segregation protein Spo0J